MESWNRYRSHWSVGAILRHRLKTFRTWLVRSVWIGRRCHLTVHGWSFPSGHRRMPPRTSSKMTCRCYNVTALWGFDILRVYSFFFLYGTILEKVVGDLTNAFMHTSYLRVQTVIMIRRGGKWKGFVSNIFIWPTGKHSFRRWISYYLWFDKFREKGTKPHSCVLCFQMQNTSVCWSYLRHVRVSPFAKTGSFSFKKDRRLKLECLFLVNDVLNSKGPVFFLKEDQQGVNRSHPENIKFLVSMERTHSYFSVMKIAEYKLLSLL